MHERVCVCVRSSGIPRRDAIRLVFLFCFALFSFLLALRFGGSAGEERLGERERERERQRQIDKHAKSLWYSVVMSIARCPHSAVSQRVSVGWFVSNRRTSVSESVSSIDVVQLTLSLVSFLGMCLCFWFSFSQKRQRDREKKEKKNKQQEERLPCFGSINGSVERQLRFEAGATAVYCYCFSLRC